MENMGCHESQNLTHTAVIVWLSWSYVEIWLGMHLTKLVTLSQDQSPIPMAPIQSANTCATQPNPGFLARLALKHGNTATASTGVFYPPNVPLLTQVPLTYQNVTMTTDDKHFCWNPAENAPVWQNQKQNRTFSEVLWKTCYSANANACRLTHLKTTEVTVYC